MTRASALARSSSVSPISWQAIWTCPICCTAPTAAAALAREFPELPAPLLQAIRLHTTGAVGMSPLDLIVYVADVIEPGRYCAGVDKLRDMVGKVELEDLFMATLVYVVGNLIERRKLIHPDTVTVWNYYVARARERAAANDAKGSK